MDYSFLWELARIASCFSKENERHLDLIEIVNEKKCFPELRLYRDKSKTVIRYITTGNNHPRLDYFYLMEGSNKTISEAIATEALRKLKEKYHDREGLIINSYDRREI